MRIGIGLFLLGIFSFCFRTTVVGLLPSSTTTAQLMVYQNLFCLCLFVPIFLKKYDRSKGVHRIKMVLLKGVLSFVPQLLIFEAIKTLHVSDVILLNSTSPLCLPIFSMLFLGEGIAKKSWLWLLMGYLGVVLIIRPGFEVWHLGALWALLGAMCTALAIILLRTLHKSEQWSVLLLSSFVVPLIAGLMMGGAHTPLVSSSLPIFATMGAAILIGQLGITLASRYTKPTILAPFDYTSVLFALSLSFLFYGRIPGPYTVMGSVLIIASGLLVQHTERLKFQKSLSR
jgi:drug/metabolite transporter (DMT)-like permease